MQNAHKKIETPANIAIILLAVTVGVVMINRLFFSASAKPAEPGKTEIEAGTKMPDGPMDWSKSERTLVMALSTTCRYCTESMPFYQKLAERKGDRTDVRIVSAMPQSPDEARQYLAEHKETVDEILPGGSLGSLVRGTPTLILVDKTGSIVASWPGRLSPDRESQVLDALFR